jgi:hypothetical protein
MYPIYKVPSLYIKASYTYPSGHRVEIISRRGSAELVKNLLQQKVCRTPIYMLPIIYLGAKLHTNKFNGLLLPAVQTQIKCTFHVVRKFSYLSLITPHVTTLLSITLQGTVTDF